MFSRHSPPDVVSGLRKDQFGEFSSAVLRNPSGATDTLQDVLQTMRREAHEAEASIQPEESPPGGQERECSFKRLKVIKFLRYVNATPSQRSAPPLCALIGCRRWVGGASPAGGEDEAAETIERRSGSRDNRQRGDGDRQRRGRRAEVGKEEKKKEEKKKEEE
ncbi:hypothetical protein EYF80_036951 [Liparis tanakae]|uniref:Uncharacterized protein n=1 Tax=Liparis tanakae TaxID=230148 RepID=A0A4Z2GI50_9TELE|nr:hypothetical protein EYF80_036951 [Liparis tanakae]